MARAPSEEKRRQMTLACFGCKKINDCYFEKSTISMRKKFDREIRAKSSFIGDWQ